MKFVKTAKEKLGRGGGGDGEGGRQETNTRRLIVKVTINGYKPQSYDVSTSHYQQSIRRHQTQARKRSRIKNKKVKARARAWLPAGGG